MTCEKCKNTGILNQANGKDFYYCRTCKEEIFLVEASEEITLDITDEDKMFSQHLDDLAEIFDLLYQKGD